MKKIVTAVMLCVLLLSLWVIEPLSFHPFYDAKEFSVKSTSHFHCETDKQQSSLQSQADELFSRFINDAAFMGVSIGIHKQACGNYTAAAGYSSKQDQQAFKTNTINRIASISKPMTAIAIMQLHEQGKLDLDAPIKQYLPNLSPKFNSAITIRHLLNHTSGIPHYASRLDAMSFTHYKTSTETLNFIAQKNAASEPGERFIYSSYGYSVLGAIIESVSQQSYEDYLRINIWQKAGMTNTSLERELDTPNKSRLYLKAGSFFIRSPQTDLSLIYAAGGIQSTTEDLIKFGIAILNNTLISPTSLAQMIDASDSLAPAAGDNPYGLGWYVRNDPINGKMIMHSGAQPGVNSSLKIYLDKGIVVAAISNAFGSQNSLAKLSKEMEELVLPQMH